LIEIYKEDPKSFIHLGDCRKTMDVWLKSFENKVDLVYIDPPPSSGFNFKLIQKVGINQGKITHSTPMSLNKDKDEYLQMLKDVFSKSKKLLKDSGNIFVHCSTKTSSAVRNILDSVFGTSNFVNEIIYKNNDGSNSIHHFSFSHDTILFYRKSSQSYFNPEPTAKERGKKRRNHMKKNLSEDGRVYFSIVRHGKQYRYYEDDLIHMGDVWDDLYVDFENDRFKYEGQKPLNLLERIIITASPESGLVCDPFCGTGTLGAVAIKNNRSFLMCDSSHFAINISKNAIAQFNKSFGVVWEDINIYKDKPSIKFSFKNMKVHLDEYKIKGGDKYYKNDLIPTENTLVESWSVGRIIGSKYYIDDFDIRTHEKPTLGRFLVLASKEGEPTAVTWDVFGNQLIHKLNIEKG